MPLESVRQWILIVLCTLLVTMCLLAVRRVYKTQRLFTQDSLLILLEAFKLVLYFIYEFFASYLIMLLIVFMI